MTHRTGSAHLFQCALSLFEAGHPFASAVVLEAMESSPVKAGARALIQRDGTIHGTVGGGAVEAEVQRQARTVIDSGNPALLDFDLHGPGVHEGSPICGGRMRLLVTPVAPANKADYRQAVEALARRESGVWVTTLRKRRKLQVLSDYVAGQEIASNTRSHLQTMLRSCLAQRQPQLHLLRQSTPGGKEELFVEPVTPAPMLVIVGGGHIGQAVAAQASHLDFDIVVIEDRPEFVKAALFPPGTRTLCGAVPDQLATIPFDHQTFIVLVTRGHQQDSLALRACIRQPVAYIGMIGSRRKVPLIRRQFLRAGWASASEFGRVYAPIGLDIGAVTPAEIATSILAQIIAVRRLGSAPGITHK